MPFSNLMLLMSLLSFVTSVSLLASRKHWQYIIVGAGPAGLQIGYYMHRANRDYVILERSSVSGSFFTIYPRHDRLISINKRHTGKTNKEFNLRHDWNSLISDDETMKFGRYSKEFFPRRSTYVEYLNDFESTFGLNVEYDTDVRDVSRAKDGDVNDATTESVFSMYDQHGNRFTCTTLLIATGMWQPNVPDIEGLEYADGYEDVPVDPDGFEGQSVLILGRGNAAFEVADRIYGSTNLIHMAGRSRVRLSWSTHYVGDLRGVNNALLDTYQLKSLDAVLEAKLEDMRIVRDGSKFILNVSSRSNFTIDSDNFSMRDPYDRVIRCLGFRFNESLFASNVSLTRGKGRQSKYPTIKHNYESVDLPGMYFVGTVTHSLDLRKSAGGFIHGFRYTSRALHRILEWKNHGIPWPSKTGSVSHLVPTILKRINEASGIYQMFGVLCDIVALSGDSYAYFEEFPINLLHEFEQHSGSGADSLIVLLLEYGANFSGPAEDTFRVDRASGLPSDAHLSNFLHPVFYYYKQLPTRESMDARSTDKSLPRPDAVHHIVEDFLTSWDGPTSHILPLRRFLENVLGRDLRYFFADDCLALGLMHQRLPFTCDGGLVVESDFFPELSQGDGGLWESVTVTTRSS